MSTYRRKAQARERLAQRLGYVPRPLEEYDDSGSLESLHNTLTEKTHRAALERILGAKQPDAAGVN